MKIIKALLIREFKLYFRNKRTIETLFFIGVFYICFVFLTLKQGHPKFIISLIIILLFTSRHSTIILNIDFDYLKLHTLLNKSFKPYIISKMLFIIIINIIILLLLTSVVLFYYNLSRIMLLASISLTTAFITPVYMYINSFFIHKIEPNRRPQYSFDGIKLNNIIALVTSLVPIIISVFLDIIFKLSNMQISLLIFIIPIISYILFNKSIFIKIQNNIKSNLKKDD